MRLFLTRDGAGSRSTFAWVAEQAPTLHGQQWVHDGDVHSVSDCDYDIPPGTCTELFTEREVRMRVAKAISKACDDELFIRSHHYLNDPSNDNWARLMAEVGAGGASNV